MASPGSAKFIWGFSPSFSPQSGMNKVLVLNLSSFFDSSAVEKQVTVWNFGLLKDSLGSPCLLKNLAELKKGCLTDFIVCNVRADDNTICVSLRCTSKVYSFLRSSF